MRKKKRTSQFDRVVRVLVTVPAVHALPLLRVGIEPQALRTISVTTVLLLLIVIVRRVRSLLGLIQQERTTDWYNNEWWQDNK